MKILGISSYYHDSAICLMKDGKILYAAQEERFSRIKNDAAFPSAAIKNCLQYTNTNLSDIDAIVFYEKPFLKLERILNSYLDIAPKGWMSFIKAMHVWTKSKLFIKQDIYKALKEIDHSFDKRRCKLLFSEHHLSHAASSFFTSPFQEAAILTIDGVGEYATTSLSYGESNKITPLREIHFPHSLGLLYSSITYYLGFTVNSDEYKVMGLAAYGDPESEETIRYINIIESELIRINEDGSYQLNMNNFSFTHSLTMVNAKVWQKLLKVRKREPRDELTQSHCNLAFAFQKVTEKAILQLCSEIKRMTHSENLCLAGGVALNCVINGIIKDKKVFKHLFVQPAAGDAGAAIGCAYGAYYLHFENERELKYPDAMENGLLGDSIPEEDIGAIAAMHPNHYRCENLQELCKKTAQLIADGKVVGWVQNRMEFGPRALGNRSILADAQNLEMQLHLNLKIKNRESFRPFAPAVLEEDVNGFFEINGTSPYMLQVHKVKVNHLKELPPEFNRLSLKEKLYTVKSDFPAVTHVDLTARIQTVNRNSHPVFWNLINEFKNLTGTGMIINTSFNVNNEPIVRSASDAYNCFLKTEMDVLAIGNLIFYK